MPPQSVAIIDAGLAGLITAALAARAGRSVLLIGRATPHAVTLHDAGQTVTADLAPQLWPADVLTRLVRHLDLRLNSSRPPLPLQLQFTDRTFNDWQDAARRTFTRAEWAVQQRGRFFWEHVDRLALQSRTQLGGAGGVVNALRVWAQRPRCLHDELQRFALHDDHFLQLVTTLCRLAGSGDGPATAWVTAANALAAGGPARAVIRGGTPAFAAALRDALLRDGALILARTRLKRITTTPAGCMIELRDGTTHRVDQIISDGGRPQAALASLAAVISADPPAADSAALQAWPSAGDNGAAVAWLMQQPLPTPGYSVVTLQQTLPPERVQALTQHDRHSRQAAHQALQRDLSAQLQLRRPTAVVQQSRLLLSAPRAPRPANPAVTPLMRSDQLSSRYGADLIEAIGTARRLGYW